MKTLLIKLRFAIIASIFFGSLFINAQELYQDQLETVYLNNQEEEVVYTNDFSSYNSELLHKEIVDFRTEIKKARDNEETLLFLSDRSNIEFLSAFYLKIIRKGANRSADLQSFEEFLHNELPELTKQFQKDNNLEELYFLTRKNTFNGKLDALPSVI